LRRRGHDIVSCRGLGRCLCERSEYSRRRTLAGCLGASRRPIFAPRWATGPKLDISYGDNSREKLDLFLPEGEPKGLFVFVHGGFWLKLDKSYWSHLASGALAHGWAVAMPSYPLCPEVRLSAISRSVAKAVALLRTGSAGRSGWPAIRPADRS
jgi:acetyl esterase/lipase